MRLHADRPAATPINKLLTIKPEGLILFTVEPTERATMTKTIQAEELKSGDLITGDRIYASGLLHFEVQEVSVIDAPNPAYGDRALITVRVLSGEGKYQIERTISYAADEEVHIATKKAGK